MKKQACTLSLAVVLLFCGGSFLHGQTGTTANFLRMLPHQSDYNPAYYTPFRGYAGIPIISSLQLDINNDAFSIRRSTYQRRDTTFIDVNSILSNLSEKNNLGFNFSTDVIRFGFRIGSQNTLHFGLKLNAYGNLLLTKNTFKFFLSGPGYFLDRNDPFLDGNRLSVNLFSTAYIGYTRELSDRFSVGARFKYYSGMYNISTENSEIAIDIDNGEDPNITPYTYNIRPNFRLRASLNDPNNEGFLASAQKLSLSGFPLSSPNFGFGFDLGVQYKISDALTVAASVSDVGYIGWKADVKEFSSSGHSESFVFSGLGSLTDLLRDDEFNIQSFMGQVKDSVIDYLQLRDTVGAAYRTWLPYRINLTFLYDFTEKDAIGVMWNGQFGEIRDQKICIAYRRRVGQHGEILVSNTIINQNFLNFGAGFTLQAGPVQFFLIVDKLNSFRVIDMRSVNLQVGLNLVFNRIYADPLSPKPPRRPRRFY